MISLKSDYSPQAAPELQESENIRMLEMLLFMAGMNVGDLQYFVALSDKTAKAYTDALGDEQDWQAAQDAAKHGLTELGGMLVHHGITVTNTIHQPVSDGYFAHIETIVYTDYGKMELIGRIERPVTDIEAKTYENNSSGYGCTIINAPVDVPMAGEVVH